MIRALLIDDEPNCITALQADLRACGVGVEVVGTCTAAKDALLAVRQLQPDLLFLDVEMPWMNGFELLEALAPVSFQVIFTTAYDQFAARAFRVSAIDYLLKPIDPDDLCDAVARVRERLADRAGTAHLDNLLRNTHLPAGRQKIAIPVRDGYEFVLPEDILYGTADGGYTRLALTGGRQYLVSRSLGEMEGLLPPEQFERVHHSHLVNLQHVAQFCKSEGALLVMANGEEISVSKARRDGLLQKLGIRSR